MSPKRNSPASSAWLHLKQIPIEQEYCKQQYNQSIQYILIIINHTIAKLLLTASIGSAWLNSKE